MFNFLENGCIRANLQIMFKLVTLVIIAISQVATAANDYKLRFSNLRESDRVRYIDLVKEVDHLNRKYKICSAYLKLIEAEKIFTGDPSLKFRQATFYASLKDEVDARRCYLEVLEAAPNDFYAMESLSELSYRHQMWAQCNNDIETLRTAHPERTSVYPLLAYKQMIWLHKLGENKKFHYFMVKFTKDFSYMEDTPMCYYLQALDALLHSDEAEAIHSIKTSWRVFKHHGLHKSWSNALVNAGLIDESKVRMQLTKKYNFIPFTL